MASHASTLAWKSHGRRSLVGCSPWGHYESDTTERLHFHFSLSHIGEGNGNPLQWSCLENPRDRAAWWAAVYGVAQNQTKLKWLSSSSPRWQSGKESACQFRRHGFDSWVGKIPWWRKWRPTPVFLPGKFQGQKSLVGYSPWGHDESDTSEWLHTQRHLGTSAGSPGKNRRPEITQDGFWSLSCLLMEVWLQARPSLCLFASKYNK